MKKSLMVKVFTPLLVVFATLLFLIPRNAKWGYEYTRGQSWRYERLIAQFDFPILKTKSQIDKERLELEKKVIPYYKFSSEVSAESFRKLESVTLPDSIGFRSAFVKHLADIYYKGVLSTTSDSDLIIVQKDKRAQNVPYSEVYTLNEGRISLLQSLSLEFPTLNVDSLFRKYALNDLLEPNLIYDEQLTNLVSKQHESRVSTTSGYMSAGTILINPGELVTAELEQILDSYKAEYQNVVGTKENSFWAIGLGNALLILSIIVCLYFAIFFSNHMVFKDYNRYLYLLAIFLMMASVQILFIRFKPDYIYIFPFSVGALYLQAFFKTRVIYPVYIVSLLPMLIYAQNGPALFLMYLVPGIVTLSVFRRFSKGVKQFLAALINFAVTAVIFLAFELMGVVNENVIGTLALLFAASLLEVAFHPFVYLLERIFNLVSSSRLQELSDTSNELLRNLEHNAPGTFQHCLQVMNLASAAARSIQADEDLVRAGALYHDIGKSCNPQCFVENEIHSSAENRYHKDLSPLQSAQDIIRHVSDGLELAHSHNLPTLVSDFISTHHGTTQASFFYDKYLKEGGDPKMAGEFRYPGPIPQTKEQVILMLSDSIEAASRTLKDYSAQSISNLVEDIFASKISDGQLEQADITLKELTTIKSVIKSYLGQMYHARIKYPKYPKTKNK